MRKQDQIIRFFFVFVIRAFFGLFCVLNRFRYMNTFSNELNIFQKLFTFHLNLTEALYWIMHSRRRREACDCKSICMVYSYLFIIDGFRTRECWVGRIILIDNSNTNTWLYVNSEVQLYPIGKYPIMWETVKIDHW